MADIESLVILLQQTLDILFSTMLEECVLLKTIENNHMTTCQNGDNEARNIRLFIEKYIPDIRKSKVFQLLILFSETEFYSYL